MNDAKKQQARRKVDFLRSSLRSLVASTPGQTRADALALVEVEQDLHNLLEAYAMGNIPDTRQFLADPAPPLDRDAVAIR
jgi:hypothetical protein